MTTTIIPLTNRLSNIINGKSIIKSANKSNDHFCFNVIALLFTNDSKCFLYNFVLLNHLSNLFEPLAKQYDAKSKNGVVGSTGSTTPIEPKANDIIPAVRYRYFFILFINITSFNIFN